MGKLIRNGIEYGGGNGTDIFEVTQAEYDALEQAGTLVHNALYVITDAPNLNATASDIEYSGAVTVADQLATNTEQIKFINATIGAVDFTGTTIVDISSSKPTTPTGYVFLCAVVRDVGTVQSGNTATVNVDGISGSYLYGTSGCKYSNVLVRYIYIKT